MAAVFPVQNASKMNSLVGAVGFHICRLQDWNLINSHWSNFGLNNRVARYAFVIDDQVECVPVVVFAIAVPAVDGVN